MPKPLPKRNIFVTVESVDRAEEWRRLKDLYLHMSDEEVEVVADDGYDLTDVARQALQGEIARRGLKLELKNRSEPAPEPQGDAVPNADELNAGERAAGMGSRRGRRR